MLIAALVTLGDPGRLTGGYLYHQRMAALAARHGVRLVFVAFPDRPFPLPALAAPAVLRQARAQGARVLVLDSIAAAFFGCWSARLLAGWPLVAMLHQPPGGIDYGPLRTAVQAWLDRRAYRAAHCLLVASELLRTQLTAQGVPPGRVQVVPPGRDLAAVAGPPPGDLRQGRAAALLCVGNWVPRKGIHSLLAACARLPAPAATLHLVGDTTVNPTYAARLRARIARPDLAGRVVVHGPLPAAQVAALYAAADVFVLPSVKEPYGTVYGEAMAAGLPVVGWRAGNLPFLARDGQEGLLVAPGDVPGLTTALQRLAANPGLRRTLGAAARRRAQTWPTWEESAARFCGAIRAVAAAAGVPLG